MADERVVDKIVTKFLLNTCRLFPRLNEHAVEAAMTCAMAPQTHYKVQDGQLIPLITGSIAELYIEPMLPYVGDIDVMGQIGDVLAIPRGHPPPSRLPAEFLNFVKVCEITDSHLSGYVYLKLRYLLTKCTDSDRYNVIDHEGPEIYFSLNHNGCGELHGPANVHRSVDLHSLSVDLVRCVRCLTWPSQAADWSSRYRNYGWPDSATVNSVLSNGCDLVRVAHRHCRQDEWTVILTCRNCTDKQLDASTTDCLSYAEIFHEDRAHDWQRRGRHVEQLSH